MCLNPFDIDISSTQFTKSSVEAILATATIISVECVWNANSIVLTSINRTIVNIFKINTNV